jgi:hypothetical protein
VCNGCGLLDGGGGEGEADEVQLNSTRKVLLMKNWPRVRCTALAVAA